MVMVGRARWRLHVLGSIAFAFVCSTADRATADSLVRRADGKPTEPIHADLVLKGGTLIDGTGTAARQADVAVKAGRIVAVGSFECDPKTRVIDVRLRVVAPGFIDLHTHSDPGISQASTRLNQNYLTQGVTTVVTGNCGLGVSDVEKYLAAIDAHGAGTNVIHLVPLGTVRSAVMGKAERPPTESELERMKRLVDRGMDAGAWGIASGLIYVPGRYADTSELIELAKVARRHGGIYASHIRNEGARLLESIDEAIAIGKGADIPVHISHLKASGKAYWGTVGTGPRPDRPGASGRADRHRRSVSLHRVEHPARRDGRAALGDPGFDR